MPLPIETDGYQSRAIHICYMDRGKAYSRQIRWQISTIECNSEPMASRTSQAIPVFVLAFVSRAIAALVTTLTNLNPDSTEDAVRFGETAETIALGMREGQSYLFTFGSIDILQLLDPFATVGIYKLWGAFLAPYWLLPGPSGFYARLVNAFLGAFAIYNVYLIARFYHSHHAGVVAALPMMFYPSYVAIHSTLLREAAVLLGITLSARLLLIPSGWRSRVARYLVAGVVLYPALLLRTDNAVIYGAALVVAFLAYAVDAGHVTKHGIGAVGAVFALIYLLPLVQRGIDYLAWIRQIRATGRTVYLSEAIPQTALELLLFSWVGAAYFLYAPFPWMVETLPDMLVSIEGFVSLVFTVASLWGVRAMLRKNAPATVGLLAGLGVAVVLYGVGTVNYGTGMRHRQMFLWVIFLFGGIGISELVWFEWSTTLSPDQDVGSSTETR